MKKNSLINEQAPRKVNIGNDKEYKGIAFIAFIDILGFSKNIEDNWNAKENNPLDIILKIKNELNNIIVEDNLVVHTADGKEKLDIQIESKIMTISDCFIIAHPIKQENAFSCFAGIYNITKNIIMIWNSLIENGFTIRGAISYGEVYWNEKEIIGPAYITAYRHEEEYAKVSRVILTSECNKVYKMVLNSEFARVSKNLIIKDVDGYSIINSKLLYKNETERLKLVETIVELKNKTKNIIISEKYISLLNLLNMVKANSELLDY
jgi:hypothetical protein